MHKTRGARLQLQSFSIDDFVNNINGAVFENEFILTITPTRNTNLTKLDACKIGFGICHFEFF